MKWKGHNMTDFEAWWELHYVTMDGYYRLDKDEFEAAWQARDAEVASLKEALASSREQALKEAAEVAAQYKPDVFPNNKYWVNAWSEIRVSIAAAIEKLGGKG
jgi:hypothetical protein